MGKNGDVTFSNETKVGDLVLKPARYQLQHRVDGSDHFVHFTEVTKEQPYRRRSGVIPKAHPGEAKSKLEPLGKKVSQTKVYSTKENGAYRVNQGGGCRGKRRPPVLASTPGSADARLWSGVSIHLEAYSATEGLPAVRLNGSSSTVSEALIVSMRSLYRTPSTRGVTR